MSEAGLRWELKVQGNAPKSRDLQRTLAGVGEIGHLEKVDRNAYEMASVDEVVLEYAVDCKCSLALAQSKSNDVVLASHGGR